MDKCFGVTWTRFLEASSSIVLGLQRTENPQAIWNVLNPCCGNSSVSLLIHA